IDTPPKVYYPYFSMCLQFRGKIIPSKKGRGLAPLLDEEGLGVVEHLFLPAQFCDVEIDVKNILFVDLTGLK
ncbi:MAG: hypothetical protein ACE5GQ_12400, partial [Nitrospinales bacterium]